MCFERPENEPFYGLEGRKDCFFFSKKKMTWYRQVLYYFCFRNGRDHGKTSKLLGFVIP